MDGGQYPRYLLRIADQVAGADKGHELGVLPRESSPFLARTAKDRERAGRVFLGQRLQQPGLAPAGERLGELPEAVIVADQQDRRPGPPEPRAGRSNRAASERGKGPFPARSAGRG